MSPQTHEGVHYNWACAFRKQQNKKQLGAVHRFAFQCIPCTMMINDAQYTSIHIDAVAQVL